MVGSAAVPWHLGSSSVFLPLGLVTVWLFSCHCHLQGRGSAELWGPGLWRGPCWSAPLGEQCSGSPCDLWGCEMLSFVYHCGRGDLGTLDHWAPGSCSDLLLPCWQSQGPLPPRPWSSEVAVRVSAAAAPRGPSWLTLARTRLAAPRAAWGPRSVVCNAAAFRPLGCWSPPSLMAY